MKKPKSSGTIDPAALTSERGKTHGDWLTQSMLAQDLKRSLLYSYNYKQGLLTSSQREALEMIAIKMSRICTGNPEEQDHWLDIMGYAQLAKDGGHKGD